MSILLTNVILCLQKLTKLYIPTAQKEQKMESSSSFGTITLCGFSLSPPNLSKFFYP